MLELKTTPELPEHEVKALIKFGTSREEFLKICKETVPALIKDEQFRKEFDFDQIQIVGTVGGEIKNELRFVKFKKMRGVDLIAKEREEQKTKHGFTDEYQAQHPQFYSNHELVRAAMYALDTQHNAWPSNWGILFGHRISEKSYMGRLAVAGALIAAEMDRILDMEPDENLPK